MTAPTDRDRETARGIARSWIEPDDAAPSRIAEMTAEIAAALTAAREEGRREEREACAKACEARTAYPGCGVASIDRRGWEVRNEIAAAIRARGTGK